MPAHVDTKAILVATVGRPHGVRGLVRLFAATDHPSRVEDLGPLFDEGGALWRAEWQGAGIARLYDSEGRAVVDRDAAAKMVNRKLYARRESLPVLDAEEFYHVDLVGLLAEGRDGALLGTVTVVHDYGGGVSLEISGGPVQSFIVPFTRLNVPEIDFERQRVVIELPQEVVLEGDVSPESLMAVRK